MHSYIFRLLHWSESLIALYFECCYCWIISWVNILMCSVIALFSVPVMSVPLFMDRQSHLGEFLVTEKGGKV